MVEVTKQINFFVTEKEWILIKNLAKKNQQSIRSYIKKISLDHVHEQVAKNNKEINVNELEFDEHKLEKALENDDELKY